MKTRKFKLVIPYAPLIAMLTVGFFLFACEKGKKSETVIHPSTASLMAVHASPDASTSDFYLADAKLSNTVLGYGDHTNYVNTKSGTQKAEFRGVDSHTVLASADVDLKEKKNYTVFLAGPVAAAQVIAVEDDLTAPAAGKARVRFVNLSADDTKWDIQLKGGDKLATQRAYKTVTNFIDVVPGDLTYQLVDAADANRIIDLPAFTIQVGKIYTIWVKGSQNGVGAAALGASLIEHTR